MCLTSHNYRSEAVNLVIYNIKYIENAFRIVLDVAMCHLFSKQDDLKYLLMRSFGRDCSVNLHSP